MRLPLSVLDLIPIGKGTSASQALADSLRLARHVESLGYTRHWVAEHHNTSGLASSSPEIVIALLGRETTRLRVGSGGIMLPNHSPLKVAENFRTLEALFPGRVDLGVGRAPGTDPLTALALRRSRERLGADDFRERLQELAAYCGEGPLPTGSPFEKIIATPEGVPLPPLWLLSSSGYGALLAAELGRGLAFAHHFSPAAALESMLAYRERFRPSAALPRPYSILTVSVVCAPTEEEAEALARCIDLMWIRFHRRERGPLPTVEEARAYRFSSWEEEQVHVSREMLTWGTPGQVREKLEALASQMQADELMVTTHLGDAALRRQSYELLAQAFSR